MSQETRDPEQVISEYAAVWNERDLARIPEVVSESYTAIEPGDEYHGRDALEGWIEETTSAFPDFEVEPLDIVVDGETVMAEAKYTMTHEGEYNGIPPTGETVEMQSMAKFRVEDGKVVEHREYFDRQEMAEQLGVVEE